MGVSGDRHRVGFEGELGGFDDQATGGVAGIVTVGAEQDDRRDCEGGDEGPAGTPGVLYRVWNARLRVVGGG